MLSTFTYPDAISVVICGDIHGEFEKLVYLMCTQYDMHDTLVIVAGDCGFGFYTESYYEQVYQRIQKRLSAHNCWIAMIRGNHDDPSYFAEQKIHHKRFYTIPDYSIIQVCDHRILCVGGATSIDRSFRLAEMRRRPDRPSYWQEESVRYDAAAFDEIKAAGVQIDTVVTHTAPSFCELQSKNGLASWAANDPDLLRDCENERKQMDLLFSHLERDRHPVTHWFYGHFHQSWHNEINGILFKMLDCMEMYELRTPPFPAKSRHI